MKIIKIIKYYFKIFTFKLKFLNINIMIYLIKYFTKYIFNIHITQYNFSQFNLIQFNLKFKMI